MFLTKKFIPRRTFLRGTGCMLALPLLEAMVPALRPIRLSAAAPVKRFVGIWHPHGAAPGYWSPTKEGKNFEYSEAQKEIFKNDPEKYLKYRKNIESELNVRFRFILNGSPEQAAARKVCGPRFARE